MNRRAGSRRSSGLLLLLPLLVPSSAHADTYRLLLPRNAPAPVQFGAAELARALAEAGHRLARGRGGVAITVALGGPWGPEGFAIQRRGTTVRVAGGDAVGAMYGLMEVGEQVVESGAGRGLLQAVRPAIGRPYLSLRADSPRLVLEPDGRLPPFLADRGFWARYVAGLARGRFNLLHLHGFVDPATGRARSLLERLVPAAGAPDNEARRALSALGDLAALCRRRGVRLALTDDAASEATAPATSARRLMAAVPGLWALGARAGGPGASTLLTALAKAVAPRAFLAWPEQQAQGEAEPLPPVPARAMIGLPVNGGSFGLPYPVLGSQERAGGSMPVGPVPGTPGAEAVLATLVPPPATPAGGLRLVDPRRLRTPHPERLIWEVPAGGVVPFLPWGDPIFIRRLVRAAAMGVRSPTGSPGILVEPPLALFGDADKPGSTSSLIPHPSSLVVPWWWHRTWGRLAYDPAEPVSRIEAAFQRRYGSEPGWRIAQTLARASTVVPLIAAIHARPGGACRAPEWEPGTLEEWSAAPALDPHTVADVRTWAAMRISGREDGRLDPVRISFLLAETAMRLRGEVDTIEILRPRAPWDNPTEWRELRRQIEALCHLADFAARRLSAAAHLELYRQTGDEMELEHVLGQAPMAAASWAAMQRLLSAGGEREVGKFELSGEAPVLDGSFAADAATVAEIQADLARELAAPRAAPRIAHIPAQRAAPTRSLRVNATVFSGSAAPVVTLVYRLTGRDGSSGPERELAMTRLFAMQAFYQAEIPGSEMVEGFLEYRIDAAAAPPAKGAVTTCPGPQAWFRLPVTRDEAGPMIRPLPPITSARSVLLACEVTDPAGVGPVRLHVRPLAALEPWRVVQMAPAGSRCVAEVPLTADGLQYSFEAADAWGNTSVAPDVTTETTYFLVPPHGGEAGERGGIGGRQQGQVV